MTGRERGLIAVAAIAAAVCVALGVWQIRRLGERRAYNASVLARYDAPPVPLESLGGDTTALEYRRVIVTGAYDSARDLALANRPRRGAPGVHLLSALRRDPSDTATLVARGWAYAPDASNADMNRSREDSARRDTGYVRLFRREQSPHSALRTPGSRIFRALDYDSLSRSFPYALRPYYVVLTASADTGGTRPPRLDSPAIGEGNHLSYAIQWFAFAFIAVVGAAIVVMRSRRGTPPDARFRPQ